MHRIRHILLSIPILGQALQKTYNFILRRPNIAFESSSQYWDERYRKGGTSGSGSYGRLAEFKAQFLNEFIKTHNISTCIEFGCGDGNQISLINYKKYIGFDVSNTAIEICRKRHKNRDNYEFHLTCSDKFQTTTPAELAISLDVIYHLVEEQVYRNYMEKLFSSSRRYVIIYAYDREQRHTSKHELGRNFTSWIKTHAPQWTLINIRKNPYPFNEEDPNNTSHSDFFVFENTAKEQ